MFDYRQLFFEWFLAELLKNLDPRFPQETRHQSNATVAPRVTGEIGTTRADTRGRGRNSLRTRRPGERFQSFRVSNIPTSVGDDNRNPERRFLLPRDEFAIPTAGPRIYTGNFFFGASAYFWEDGIALPGFLFSTLPADPFQEELHPLYVAARSSGELIWFGYGDDAGTLRHWRTSIFDGEVPATLVTTGVTDITPTEIGWASTSIHVGNHDDDSPSRVLAFEGNRKFNHPVGTDIYDFPDWVSTASLQITQEIYELTGFSIGVSGTTAVRQAVASTGAYVGSATGYVSRYYQGLNYLRAGQNVVGPNPAGADINVKVAGIGGPTGPGFPENPLACSGCVWVTYTNDRNLSRGFSIQLAGYDHTNETYRLAGVFTWTTSAGALGGDGRKYETYQQWLDDMYDYANGLCTGGQVIPPDCTPLDRLDAFDHAAYRAASGVDADPTAFIDPTPYDGASSIGWGAWRLIKNGSYTTEGYLHYSFDVKSDGTVIRNELVEATEPPDPADEFNGGAPQNPVSFFSTNNYLPSFERKQIDYGGGVGRFLYWDVDSPVGQSGNAIKYLFVLTYNFDAHEVLDTNDLLPGLGITWPQSSDIVMELTQNLFEGEKLLVLDIGTNRKVYGLTTDGNPGNATGVILNDLGTFDQVAVGLGTRRFPIVSPGTPYRDPGFSGFDSGFGEGFE